MKKKLWIGLIAGVALLGGGGYYLFGNRSSAVPFEQTVGPKPTLADARKELIPVVNAAKAIGWPDGQQPVAAKGLAVNLFAKDLVHPRWLYVLPNGDILVAETNAPSHKAKGLRDMVEKEVKEEVGAAGASPNRITLLRDADGDGTAEFRSTLIDNLDSPFGMALIGEHLYIANTSALVRVPYKTGDVRIVAKPEKLTDLPSGENHWTRGLLASPDGKSLFISVGSASNIAEKGLEKEKERAAILEYNLETAQRRIYAYGLRNPVGLAYEPETNQMWTVVNERDMLGPDLVPDYLTQVDFGTFYGWPWFYWGGYVDERVPPPEDEMLKSYSQPPDYALGAHVGAVGLTFAHGAKLGDSFASGAFIGQHGSWNRTPKSGYKVVFVPFEAGKPKGMPIDILTGFLSDKEEAYGRPVGLAIRPQGDLLVADDVGNRVWRVSNSARQASDGNKAPPAR